MTNEEKERMLEELLAASRPKTRDDYPQPNLTSKEIAAREGVTTDQLKGRLLKAVQDGTYGTAQVLYGGKRTNIYWLKAHETQKRPTP